MDAPAADRASRDASVVLEVDGVEIPMAVPAGVSTLSAPVNSAVTDVSMSSADTSDTICVVGLAFGSVVPAEG